MASRELGIDPAGVHAGAALVAAAAAAATPAGITAVAPCAGDDVSGRVAGGLTSRIGALDRLTAAANRDAQAAAARLRTGVNAYQQQEWSSARALGTDGAAAGPPVPSAQVAPSPLLPLAAATPVGGGVRPTSGRQASALLHAGPGPQGLDAAQAALAGLADRLDQAEATVRAARGHIGHSWQSGAADAALAQLADLESRYGLLAADARGLAREARVQADNFRRTKAQMPTPQVFEELSARWRAASAANAMPGSLGMYRAQAAEYEREYAATERGAMTARDWYDTSTANVLHSGPPADTGQGPAGTAGFGGAGDTPPGAATSDKPSAPPADPVTNPLLGGAASGAGKMLETVVPAIVSGVTGGLGGVLGAVTGAAPQLIQAGGQVASQLAQTASTAIGSSVKAGSPPPHHSGGSGGPSGGSPDDTQDVGDIKPGDTEPSSGPAGPLAAPASAAEVPAAAAPETVSTAAAPASAPAMTGAPSSGAMMAPMMGAPGAGRGGSADDDRRLYAQRRLRIETPPNTEPVKGRREARRSREDAPGG